MVTRVGGARRKTRGLLKKSHKMRGKISLRHYLQDFSQGDKVALKLDPSIDEGVFHRRYYGKIGVVKSQQGACYVVEVRDGGKLKDIIAHPAHIRAVR